jgi:hypothetical protein
MNQQLLYDLLNRALIEEMGLVVECQNPQRMSFNLHKVRAANPAFAEIEITVPSTPNTVMLVKKSVELNEPVWGNGEGDLPDV